MVHQYLSLSFSFSYYVAARSRGERERERERETDVTRQKQTRADKKLHTHIREIRDITETLDGGETQDIGPTLFRRRPQAAYEKNSLVDNLLAAIGAGTASCTNACSAARAAVYGSVGSVPRSLVQLAACGSWGRWPANTVS